MGLDLTFAPVFNGFRALFQLFFGLEWLLVVFNGFPNVVTDWSSLETEARACG